MRNKFKRKLQENSVFRFLTAHLVTLLFVLLVCAMGFQSAFQIVRADIIDNAQQGLDQSVTAIDTALTEMRTLGLQLSRSQALHSLAIASPQDKNYFQVSSRAVNEYTETLTYFASTDTFNTYIYLEGLDRVIYRDSIYRPAVFAQYLQGWGIDAEEWRAMCRDGATAPHFAVTANGNIHYLFPCTASLREGDLLGAIVFRLEPDLLQNAMPFLENYDRYTLLVYDADNTLLFAHDDLGQQQAVQSAWLDEAGVHDMGSNLVFSDAGAHTIGLRYLLILPQQAAMARLNSLYRQTALLILLAGILGAGLALFFSVRVGRPVNRIARALAGQGEQFSTDLNQIGSAVGKLLNDNAHLRQQQVQDLPALQKAFFHNLLKSDFVSDAEMRYMAQRAHIDLTGKTYCAAVMRLFPHIDVDSIDGQTVEETRILKPAISEEIDRRCKRPVWYYKRNTLTTLYIFEIRDQDALLAVIQGVSDWLQKGYQVESRWGVGNPCDDLMLFWKSAEEAHAALNTANSDETVHRYDVKRLAADTYYFPYAVEEHLMQGLRAGDMEAVRNALALLRQENFVRRNLSRPQFHKVNRRIMDLLTTQMQTTAEESPELMELNRLVFDYQGDCAPYFDALSALCSRLCEHSANQKSARRSETVRAVEQYLQANYQDSGMGLAMASAAFSLSEGYLSAIFKKETGTNFAEYLEQLRVQAACKLLHQGVKVADIPGQVGYNSIQSFRRAFKRVMGVSPSEYRG